MNKQVTNIIGVVVFLIVVGYICTVGYIQPYYAQKKATEDAENDFKSRQTTTESRMVTLANMKPEEWSKAGMVDAWERPFMIEVRGSSVIVMSAGPDGDFGTMDDIIREFPIKKSWSFKRKQ